MIRHALIEGWLLLRTRGLIPAVVALALAIPISLAGVTVSVRGWLAPIIELADRESVVTVLLHPRMDADGRLEWMQRQQARHPSWRITEVPKNALAERLSEWFPYLEDLLEREGSQMLPPLVEITTSEPATVEPLTNEIAVIAVGPTTSVNQLVGVTARRVARILWAVAGVLGVSAILLVAVWVHLEVHRNAEEISIMRLMGATEATVRGPFFVAVALPAAVGASASVLLTWLAVMRLEDLAASVGLAATGASGLVLGAQVLVAVVLPLGTAALTLERYAVSEE
jgi:cell division protein FtsX